ncbi:A-factor biosynthesis protein [Streptomyces sp. NA02950]|uniref:ScbA/BarX family gamma-butyrolactone biosynthesis protein n=1 Tax=Streptomyces sp. NA02950 TaxID=2742137 RepID=UPI00158FDC8C|nr:ScbA/BarX family gamma-butyrolactone biosynthesis protein [Streptomyces sp. NA02950]QKV91152.1 A-factor biosynthesis protein [Streptomyces sp. NA02950]
MIVREACGLSEPSGPTGRPLSWSRTVEREAVHRVSVAEVLLTDVRTLGDDRFEAAAQWPRSHPTFPHGGDGRHHPLMIAETLRELGIYLPTRYYAVPAGAHFLIRDLFYRLDPEAEPRAPHGATDITCHAAVTDLRTTPSGRFVSGMRLDIALSASGRRFAWAGGTARFLDGTSYAETRSAASGQTARRRLRAAVRPSPGQLAVPAARDVLVVRDGGVVYLDPADPRHPFFYDHWSDHVPGLVLLESARQAAALATDGTLTRPVACRLKAIRFTESYPPAVVECTSHGRTCVFRLRQAEMCTAVGVLQYL